MPLIEWDDKMSVGVVALDEDHKKLVGMINDLFEGILAEDSGEVLNRVLDELVAYTEKHFAHEERLFEQYGYPEGEEHKKEHARLILQVERVQKSAREGPVAVASLEGINYMKHWLVAHIQVHDKNYGPFLNECGVH